VTLLCHGNNLDTPVPKFLHNFAEYEDFWNPTAMSPLFLQGNTAGTGCLDKHNSAEALHTFTELRQLSKINPRFHRSVSLLHTRSGLKNGGHVEFWSNAWTWGPNICPKICGTVVLYPSGKIHVLKNESFHPSYESKILCVLQMRSAFLLVLAAASASAFMPTASFAPKTSAVASIKPALRSGEPFMYGLPRWTTGAKF
jgi:hypothetical protein